MAALRRLPDGVPRRALRRAVFLSALLAGSLPLPLAATTGTPSDEAARDLATHAIPWGVDEFIDRARQGDVDAVRRLLAAGMDPDVADRAGTTPLAEAARFGRTDAAAALLTAGAAPDRPAAGSTPLVRAAGEGWIETVGLLLDHGADVNRADATGATPLAVAVERGRTRTAALLLLREANPAAPAPDGTPLADRARALGHDRILAMLAQAGAVPEGHLTAPVRRLAAAARTGDPATVQALLGARDGAIVASREGAEALVAAAANGLPDVIRVLTAGGVPPDAVGAGGLTPLSAAAVHGRAAAATALAEAGAPVNAIDRSGRTALMYAVGADLKTVRALVEKGAQVNRMNTEGDSPLLLASAGGRTSVVRYLLDKGAQVNLTDRAGTSPLMAAAAAGHPTVVGDLLGAGADPTLRDREGRTALFLAEAGDNPAVLERIRSAGASRPPEPFGAEARERDAALLKTLDEGANADAVAAELERRERARAERAGRELLQAIQEGRAGDDTPRLAEQYRSLGTAYLLTDRPGDAAAALRQSAALFHIVGDPENAARAERLLNIAEDRSAGRAPSDGGAVNADFPPLGE